MTEFCVPESLRDRLQLVIQTGCSLLSLVKTLEKWVAAKASRWWFVLALLILFQFLTYRHSIGGDWYRSGNDMRYILPVAEMAGPEQVRGWVTGPWIGYRLFTYYRPITSLVIYAEYRTFGEQQASWQLLSLGIHLASSVLLALLLRSLSGQALPSLIAAAVSAFRPRMGEAIEWAPAQTDLLACFFSLAALYLSVFALKARSAWMALPAYPLLLLAMGSKEVALTVPLILAAVILFEKGLSWKIKSFWILGLLVTLGIFTAWRIHALHGMGYMPGQTVVRDGIQVGSKGSGPPKGRILLKRLIKFLVPSTLSPESMTPSPAIWLIAVGSLVLPYLRSRVRFVVAALLVVGLVLLIEDLNYLLVPSTYVDLLMGVITLRLIVFASIQRPRSALVCFCWGIAAFTPIYHIVFNTAGNVTYFPEIYSAVLTTLLIGSLLLWEPSSLPREPLPTSDSLDTNLVSS